MGLPQVFQRRIFWDCWYKIFYSLDAHHSANCVKAL